MKPRSGFLPRQRALMALSWSTSGAEAFDSATSWKRCVRPTRRTADAQALAPRALEGEPAAVDDRLVAQVERREPARRVAAACWPRARRAAPGSRPARRTSRGTRRTPPPPIPRADRVAGHQRVAADVGVGEERLAVAGEEEVLVVAQGEVGQRVPAVGVHEARGVLPVALGVLGARRQRAEQQDRQHDQADDAERRAAPPGSRRRRTATGTCTGRRARRARRTPSPARRRA